MSSILKTLLSPIDRYYAKKAGAKKLKDGQDAGRWTTHIYHGPDILLSDGVTIKDGMTVLEAHISNDKMLELMSGQKEGRAAAMVKVFADEFRLFAEAVQRGEVEEFEAMFGYTLMGPLAKRIGFDVLPLPGTFKIRMITGWQRLLRKAFHSTGKISKTQRPLQAVWLSKAKLLELYGSE